MRGRFVSVSQPGAGPAAALCTWGWHWHWNRSPEVLCCQKMQLPSASRGVTQVRHLHTTAPTSAADSSASAMDLDSAPGFAGHKARSLEPCISVRLPVHFCVFFLIF